MKRKPKLKECPFCGGEASVHYCSYSDADNYGSYDRVYCTTYDCQGSSLREPYSHQATEDAAVKRWNTRHKKEK